MKFLVIGHFAFDVAHPSDEREVVSLGGVFPAVETLDSIAEKDDAIVPVFGVHSDEIAEVKEELGRLRHVDPSGVFPMKTSTNRVHFYTTDRGARIACAREIAPPIPFEQIRRHLDANGILINMESGRDIDLETLDNIRMAIRGNGGRLHFDYHNLTTGIAENHERFRRPLTEWRRWAFMVNTVQLNEAEIAGLTAEGLSEEQTVGHLLTLHVTAVLVTRGERGMSVYRNDRKKVVRTDISAESVIPAADATGSGDVFGAAFHYHYVKTTDLLGSAGYAVHLTASRLVPRGPNRTG